MQVTSMGPDQQPNANADANNTRTNHQPIQPQANHFVFDEAVLASSLKNQQQQQQNQFSAGQKNHRNSLYGGSGPINSPQTMQQPQPVGITSVCCEHQRDAIISANSANDIMPHNSCGSILANLSINNDQQPLIASDEPSNQMISRSNHSKWCQSTNQQELPITSPSISNQLKTTSFMARQASLVGQPATNSACCTCTSTSSNNTTSNVSNNNNSNNKIRRDFNLSKQNSALASSATHLHHCDQQRTTNSDLSPNQAKQSIHKHRHHHTTHLIHQLRQHPYKHHTLTNCQFDDDDCDDDDDDIDNERANWHILHRHHSSHHQLYHDDDGDDQRHHRDLINRNIGIDELDCDVMNKSKTLLTRKEYLSSTLGRIGHRNSSINSAISGTIDQHDHLHDHHHQHNHNQILKNNYINDNIRPSSFVPPPRKQSQPIQQTIGHRDDDSGSDIVTSHQHTHCFRRYTDHRASIGDLHDSSSSQNNNDKLYL